MARQYILTNEFGDSLWSGTWSQCIGRARDIKLVKYYIKTER